MNEIVRPFGGLFIFKIRSLIVAIAIIGAEVGSNFSGRKLAAGQANLLSQRDNILRSVTFLSH